MVKKPVSRRDRAREIQRFILENVAARPTDIVRAVSEQFSVSRQTALEHVRRLVEQGTLEAIGSTKSRRYEIAVLEKKEVTLVVTPELQEDEVFIEHVRPLLRKHQIASNVEGIVYYGVTEMVNNVKDHSESLRLQLSINMTALKIEVGVRDFGIGIFAKIKKAHSLDSEQDALFELHKGKLTTDPSRHTGEGIFFSSRMFDHFSIYSGATFFSCNRGLENILMAADSSIEGTVVTMTIASDSTHTAAEVFQKFATDPDTMDFDRTNVIVNLMREAGTELVSRSQARRVLARLGRFREAILDFRGIPSVGPAFTDEIFRVFAASHSEVQLVPVFMTDEVKAMVVRATRALEAQRGSELDAEPSNKSSREGE